MIPIKCHKFSLFSTWSTLTACLPSSLNLFKNPGSITGPFCFSLGSIPGVKFLWVSALKCNVSIHDQIGFTQQCKCEGREVGLTDWSDHALRDHRHHYRHFNNYFKWPRPLGLIVIIIVMLTTWSVHAPKESSSLLSSCIRFEMTTPLNKEMTTPQNKETKEKQTFFVVIGKTARKKKCHVYDFLNHG